MDRSGPHQVRSVLIPVGNSIVTHAVTAVFIWIVPVPLPLAETRELLLQEASFLGWPTGIAIFALAAFGGLIIFFVRRKSDVGRRVLEDEIEALFENGAVGIHWLDLDGRILRANRAELDILGFSREEFVGRSFSEFHTDPRSAGEFLARLENKMPLRDFETSLRARDGSPRRVLIDADHLRVDGRPSRIQCFLRDITGRKNMEEDLKRAKEEAEEAARARDRFLAILSHELRAPLTPVLIAASQQEEEEALPPEARQLNELIRRNVELEALIIDNLLDLTKICQGKLELDINTVNSHALIKNVLEICQSEINGKQIDLVLELRAQNCHVRGDSGRLHQVFWNLVKNAIKFTPPMGRVAVRSSNQGPGVLRVEVSDNGIGMEKEELSHIFQAFQGQNPSSRRFGGLGLGLSISQAIARAHRGSLTAESGGKGRGATFVLEVPAMESPFLERPLSRLLSGTPPDDHTLRILLVEDHEDSARLIAQLLRKLNYRVTAAGTLRGALQAAESEQFDLLVSDIGLPDGNGLELLGQLRKKWPIQGIALSGFGMEEDVKMSQEAGFVEHLTKPVNFQKLEMAIQRVASAPKE